MLRLVLLAWCLLLLSGLFACGRERTGGTAVVGCTRALECDDGIDCTDDSCSTSGACRHVVTPSLCIAGESCNPVLGCEPGRACATSSDCTDDDACTTEERCDPATRVCTYLPLDGDQDGEPPVVCGGTDCNDDDGAVFEGAIEQCDGRDNNCDGNEDEGLDPSTCAYCVLRSDCGFETAPHCYASLAASFDRIGCSNNDVIKTELSHCGVDACWIGCENAAFAQCACPSGTSLCDGGRDGSCSDVSSDPSHCGGCERSCTDSQICTDGECVACAGGQHRIANECVDIDECATNVCGVGASGCANTAGSYECECMPGFVAPVSGGTCEDIDACASAPCGSNSTACMNTPGAYRCSCVAGFAAPASRGSCLDIDECSDGSTCGSARVACENLPGTYSCACGTGYRAPSTAGTCVDINECAELLDDCDRPDGATCTNLGGTFDCACPSGFAGTARGVGGCVWNDPSLRSLLFSAGTLSPAFAGSVTTYTLTVRGDASVRVTATSAEPTRTSIELDGTALESGTTSAPFALSLVQSPLVVSVTTESGAHRDYTIAVVRTSDYFKASNNRDFTFFGSSVAMSADGNTLAVGAHGDSSAATGVNGNQADTTASGAGAVYVFARSGEEWTQTAYIKASNTNMYDNFGASVALSADGMTLAVGAPHESSASIGIGGIQSDNSATNSGAVYIFGLDTGVWSQRAYVKASNTGAGDMFGTAVDLSANGSTLVVAAPFDDSQATGVGGAASDDSATDAGAAYVFLRSGSTWTQQAYVKASNTDAGDMFGYRLALSGSGDVLIVGAPAESSAAFGIGGNQADNSASSAGASYVFRRSGSTWSQESYLKASNPTASDAFGGAVAISYDGTRVAVGAGGEDSSATGIDGDQANNAASAAGAVYLFDRTGASWMQTSYVKASNAEADDNFGTALRFSDDGSILIVAAPGERSNATGIGGNQSNNSLMVAGAVYMFAAGVGGWAQSAYVKASNTGWNDLFGTSLTMSADGSALAVSAHGELSNATGINGNELNDSLTWSGAVYVF